MSVPPFTHTLEFIRGTTPGLKPLSKGGTSTHVIYKCTGVTSEFESSPEKAATFFANFTQDLNHMVQTNTLGTNPVTVYERIGKEYPFFLEAKLGTDQKAEHFVPTLNRIIQKFLSTEAGFGCTDTVVIAASPHDNDGFYHARFMWKEVIVTTHQALTMRDRIVGELSVDEQDDRQKSASFRWHDLLAYNCYTNVDGVPLPGGRSYRTCKTCHGKRKESMQCQECWGIGVTQDAHTLLPYLRIVDDGETVTMSELRQGDGTLLPEDVAAFSILNSPSPRVAWVRPFGTPYYHLEQKSRAAPTVYPNALLDYYNGSARGRGASIIHGVPHAIAMLLRKAIQKAFPKYHSQVDVKADHITQDKKQTWYNVPVYGIGSNSCIKISGEHTDSRVYFLVRPTGVEQCCHSKDKISSIAGDCECRSKKCGSVAMNSTRRNALFPNEKRPATNTSISCSTSYQIACRAADITWGNMNAKKPKKSIMEYVFL
tara:strand:+ start:3032 stop:4483 length:1452 start_codon:yes stop_codon:yes gene_type:complete